MDGGTLWAHAWRTGVLGLLLLVAGVGTFLSGLGGRPLGIVWCMLALGAGVGLVAALLWRDRPGRWVAPAIVVPFALLLGASIGVRTPPGPVVLGNALEVLELPAGSELGGVSSSGNVLCFDVCPTAYRTYTVPGEPEEVAQQVRAALRDAGYTLQDPVDALSFTTELDGSREWYVAGRAQPALLGGEGVHLELRAVAAG